MLKDTKRTSASDRFEYCCGEGAPGNSVREMGERMNGGAVSEERSPENDATLHGTGGQRDIVEDACSDVRFEERCPAALLRRWHGLGKHTAARTTLEQTRRIHAVDYA